MLGFKLRKYIKLKEEVKRGELSEKDKKRFEELQEQVKLNEQAKKEGKKKS